MSVNPQHWGGRLHASRHVKGRRPHPPARATRTVGPAAPLTEHSQTPLPACSLPSAAAASQDPRAVATAGPCGSQPAVSRHPRHSMVASSRRSPRSQGRGDVDLRDEGRSRPRGAPTRRHGAMPLRARQGTCVRRAAPPSQLLCAASGAGRPGNAAALSHAATLDASVGGAARRQLRRGCSGRPVRDEASPLPPRRRSGGLHGGGHLLGRRREGGARGSGALLEQPPAPQPVALG